MPGTPAGGVPGIGTVASVPAGLPGLPSPATGVPSTPDLLTGLVSAAPNFIQSYQQGEQIKADRRKQAMEDLQVISQQAVSNPTDPAVIRQLSRAARAMGYDPKVFLTTDGKSVNTGALAQYNPYFQAAMQVISNPNADPGTQKYFAKLIGLNDFEPTGVPMKQYSTDVKNFWDQLDKFSSGAGDPQAVKSAGTTAYQEAMQRGDTVTANSIMQAMQNPQLGQKTQAQVSHLGNQDQELGAMIQRDLAQSDLFKQQARKASYDALASEARVGLIREQTVEAAHKVGLIDAQQYATYQRVQTEATNASANYMKAQAALQNATTGTYRVAEQAVTNYNRSYDSIQSHLTALGAQETALQNNYNWFAPDGKTLTPAAALVSGEIQHLKQLQSQLKGPINPDEVTNAIARNAGLPNQTKILPPKPSSGTKPAQTSTSNTGTSSWAGKTISMKTVIQWAREAKISVAEAKKRLEAMHAIIKP